jgi:hypothetical protein
VATDSKWLASKNEKYESMTKYSTDKQLNWAWKKKKLLLIFILYICVVKDLLL